MQVYGNKEVKIYTRSNHTSNLHSLLNVGGVMGWTIIALVPALVTQMIFWGWGPLLNIIFAVLAAMATESICVKLRGLAVGYTLRDGSAILSACILALSLPPQLPIYYVIFGACFMMVFGKHIFGGLGANPFNPAMLAYVMLLLSFPVAMTEWLIPQAWDYLAQAGLLLSKLGAGSLIDASQIDAYSAATALDSSRSSNNFQLWRESWDLSNFIPFIILTVVYGLGGVFLIYKRIITWHIPVTVLCGLMVPATLFSLFSDAYPPAWFHLILGGSVFGAFFVATDPVSAATNRLSRLIYGLGIGLFIFIIRTWGGYADAVAFAVLFFNFVAPFLDKYIKPRVYGH